jgi:gamma-glutamyl hercynylcysteine S-oxide hydrolase
VRHRLRAGQDPGAALAAVVTAVGAAAPGSRLNLLLTDGAGIWATSWGHSLAVRVDAARALVVSEPLDDTPDWTSLPDRHLVVARPGHCTTAPLHPHSDPPADPPAAPGAP